MKSKALAMAISQRISEESVFVIDGNGIDSPSTKLAASAIKEFDIKRSFTLVMLMKMKFYLSHSET